MFARIDLTSNLMLTLYVVFAVLVTVACLYIAMAGLETYCGSTGGVWVSNGTETTCVSN